MLACTEIHQAVWQVYLLDLLTLAKQFGKYSPDLPTFAKGHFWEKCDSTHKICASGEWRASGHYLLGL